MNSAKFLLFLLFFPISLYAKPIDYKEYYKNSEGCFILFDLKNNKVITEYKTKLCSTPTPPNSTFKIPLSVMGYDRNILLDSKNPSWEFKDEYLRTGIQDWMPKQWLESVNPQIWLQYSVVWYSEMLVTKIGIDNINTYLEKFNYGNKNFKGLKSDREKLLIPWIDSSLMITSYEQLEFMKKFVQENLPVKKSAIEYTKENLLLTQSNSDYNIYAKSGAGYLKNRIAHGWYIGWVEKNNNQYIFISKIKDKTSHGKMNSVIAKQNAFEFLKISGIISE